MATSLAPTPPGARTRRRRTSALAGPGFVAAVLAGNSLTESTGGAGTLGDLAAIAGSTPARLGLGLELVGFLLLLVFVGEAAARCRRGTATTVALLAGAVSVAVKLGSAAAVLGALHRRNDLDEVAATALVAVNDAAFVLFWIGYGVFAVAAACAFSDAGLVGVTMRRVGLVLGTLTTVAGLVGSVVPGLAVPVPFLLVLLWSGVLGTQLWFRIGSGQPGAETIAG